MGSVVAFQPSRLPPQVAPERTLQEVCAWFSANGHHNHKPSTVTHYKRAFVLALEGSPGVKGKGQVAPLPSRPVERDVTEWFSRLRTAGYGERTVALMRSDLCRAFNYAATHRFSIGNPVIDAKWKPARATRRALSDVGMTWEFLRAAFKSRPREFAFLCVLRHLGLRKGEVLGLEAVHIDWKTTDALPFGALQVDQQREKANSRITTRQLKSEASHRWLALNAETRDALRVLIATEGTHHEIRCGPGGGGREITSLLFPWGEHHLGKLMKALRGIDADGFPPGDAWHVFRHTRAVELSREEEPLREIQRYLGHVSIEHTCQYLRSLDGTRPIASKAILAAGADARVKGAPTPAEPKRLPPPKRKRPKKNESPAQVAARAELPSLTEVTASVVVAVPPVAPCKRNEE